MTAFNIQNYYIGNLIDVDMDANQFLLRYAKPFLIGESSWLLRATIPFLSSPTLPDLNTEHGLGDFNVFAAYLFDTGDPAVSFGIGPQITGSTATADQLGTDKWSAGFANVLFDARSKKFQYGYLLTWQHSVTGDGDREDVNLSAFQPFGFYQLGKGLCLRSAPIWAFNLENGNHSIPIGIGKVVRKNKTVFNYFIEPQVSIWDDGPLQPEWQIFFALNMQFLK